MRTSPLPPVAVVVSFIDRINRGDVDGLGALMTENHELVVLDEPPLVGRAANMEAWRGYATAYPDYVIYPTTISDIGDHVAVIGTTTGSHLGLPDVEERKLGVIWVAAIEGERLRSWRVLPDSRETREKLGLHPT